MLTFKDFEDADTIFSAFYRQNDLFDYDDIIIFKFESIPDKIFTYISVSEVLSVSDISKLEEIIKQYKTFLEKTIWYEILIDEV